MTLLDVAFSYFIQQVCSNPALAITTLLTLGVIFVNGWTDAPNAIAFSKPEHEQKYAIKISSAAVVDLIRKMGEWSEEDNWNVPGIYFADEQALVYDLGAAFRPSPRGGWTAKRQKEAAAAAAHSSVEVTEN